MKLFLAMLILTGVWTASVLAAVMTCNPLTMLIAIVLTVVFTASLTICAAN